MKTKTITIKPSDIAAFFVSIIVILAIYFLLFHGWIYYFLYEYPKPVFANKSDSPIATLRGFNTIFWSLIILVIIINTLEGNFDNLKWKIKIPIINNSSKNDKKLLKLYMKAASLSGEGKYDEADAIYDDIEKMKKEEIL